MSEQDFPTFELVPPESDDFDPDVEIASLEDLTDPARLPAPATSDQDLPPLGSTFAIDPITGQFAKAPIRVTDAASVIQQKMRVALRTPRGVYAIFTEGFGRDDPDGSLGEVDSPEERADLQRDVRDTLLQVDRRVVSVGGFSFDYDPDSDTRFMNVVAVLEDQTQIPLEGVPLG